MTKSWRPPNWGKIKQESEGIYEDDFNAGFECGADAMLKAIREKGQPNFLAFLHHCFREVPEITIGKGKYVFIPDDES